MTLIDGDGKHESPDNISNCFLRKFSKNFNADVSNSVKIQEQPVNEERFILLEMINVDKYSVGRIMLEQRSTSAGPDGIPGVFYRKLAGVLALPLTIMFQQSIHLGEMLDIWRIAHIIPIYKGKGDRSCASSYRPISLTDVVSKLLERLVASRLKKFWNGEKLLSEHQHGFLSRCSTVSNLVGCDAWIPDLLNSLRACDVVLLDFARAFDKALHSVVMRKLSAMRIGKKSCEWVDDFLRNRSQCVGYGDTIFASAPASAPVSSDIIRHGSIT